MAQDEPPNVSVWRALIPSSYHHDVCLIVCWLRPRSVLLLFLSVVYFLSSLSYLYSDQHFLSNVNSVEGFSHCTFAQRGVLHHGDIPSSTGNEPNVLDDFHYSETSAMIFQDDSGDIDTEPSYSCDAELDDELVGRKALSSPLFIQEREEPANRRQAYHCFEESLLPSHSFFVHTSTEGPVYEPNSDLSQKRKPGRDLDNERIRILVERRKEQILSEVRTEIQKHEFQAQSDRRSIHDLTGFIHSQRREIDHTMASGGRSRRDQQLLHE